MFGLQLWFGSFNNGFGSPVIYAITCHFLDNCSSLGLTFEGVGY